MYKEKVNHYWQKFLKSGSVSDYLNYRMYKKKMEKIDGSDSEITGDSNQKDWL